MSTVKAATQEVESTKSARKDLLDMIKRARLDLKDFRRRFKNDPYSAMEWAPYETVARAHVYTRALKFIEKRPDVVRLRNFALWALRAHANGMERGSQLHAETIKAWDDVIRLCEGLVGAHST